MPTRHARRVSIVIRRARPSDERAADLVFASAAREFTRLAGSGERALAALRRLWLCGGHAASYEYAWVAEVDGRLAGVAIGFPARARYRLYAGVLRRTLGDIRRGRRLILPLSLGWLVLATP